MDMVRGLVVRVTARLDEWTGPAGQRRARALTVRVAALVSAGAGTAAMGHRVQDGVLGWCFGAGRPVVDVLVARVGVHPVAALVAVAVFAGSAVLVTAAGLPWAARRAVRRRG